MGQGLWWQTLHSVSKGAFSPCREWTVTVRRVMPPRSGLERGRVSGDLQHVFLAQLAHNLRHERGPRTSSSTRLHVVHLPHEVARRPTCDPWNWTEALQIRAVACAARECLATTRIHQDLALLHAAGRRVCGEPGTGVSKYLGPFCVLRHFDDPLADWLLLVAFESEKEPAGDASLGRHVGFHDLDPRGPWHRA